MSLVIVSLFVFLYGRNTSILTGLQGYGVVVAGGAVPGGGVVAAVDEVLFRYGATPTAQILVSLTENEAVPRPLPDSG